MKQVKNKKNKNKKDRHLEIWIAIFILMALIFINNFSWEEEEIEIEEEINPLIEILDFEIDSAKEYFRIMNIDPNCYDYMIYYNQSLRKYKGLDIRIERYVDICNNGTYCDSLHTYLLINSHGMEAILDGSRYAGIYVIDIKNKTK